MSTAPKPIVKPGSGNVLVKVHACSFSPSDYRMMSGDTNLIKKPKAWPYIPGMSDPPSLYRPGSVVSILDGLHRAIPSQTHCASCAGGDVCGTVMEVDPSDKKCIFKAGDSIVGTWDLFGIGGLAEYTLVSTKNAALLPPAVDPVVGAAMANSASHAVQVADAVNCPPFPSLTAWMETLKRIPSRLADALYETVQGQDGRSRACAWG